MNNPNTEETKKAENATLVENVETTNSTDSTHGSEKSGSFVKRTYQSSPLIVTLIVALFAAIIVQSAFLIKAVNDNNELANKKIDEQDSLITLLRDNTLEAKKAYSVNAQPTHVLPLASQPTLSSPIGNIITDDFFLNDRQPFAEMARMREEMNRLFDNSFDRFSRLPGFDDQWLETPLTSRVTMEDKGDNYLIRLNIPGMDKASLEIDLEDNLLSISGTKKDVRENKDEQGNITSRSSAVRSFSQAFNVPGDVDKSAMTSEYEEDTLTITLPKSSTENTADEADELQSGSNKEVTNNTN